MGCVTAGLLGRCRQYGTLPAETVRGLCRPCPSMPSSRANFSRWERLGAEPDDSRPVFHLLRLAYIPGPLRNTPNSGPVGAHCNCRNLVVWYFTSASCSNDLASVTGCNPSTIAHYISLDALNKIMTHAVIAGGGGGIWSYAMTTRQRRVIEALENQLAEERERAAEERERAAEERRQLLDTIESLTERLAGQQNSDGGTSRS